MSDAETKLLTQINEPIPSRLQHQYDALIAKRLAETLTDAEYAELLWLTNQVEQLETNRVAALAALARLRQTSLAELMQSLGIQPPEYV